MPWTTPGLRTLREQNRDYLLANLTGADAVPPNSRLRVLSDANAALAHGAYEYLDFLADQLLPDTAETEYLDRHGRIWVGGRKPATFAAGTISVTGINGTLVPAGARWIANGIEFEATAQATVSDAATPVSIRALTPGADGNLVAGSSIPAVSAISGVDSSATVVLVSGGIGVESDDSLRDRVLTRIQRPPQGGAASDYVAWARAVPGVTRAWASQEAGLGTVTVRVMMDDDRTGGIPNQDDLDAVANYIAVRRPITVSDVYVVAPIPQPISFKITGLTRSNNATIAAIEASEKTMFRQRGTPGGTLYRSWVDEAVSRAAGEDHHELQFETTAAISPGHIPVLGTIAYGP